MAEEEAKDMIPVKLRPGYTFKHPVSGVALQRSLPDKKTGKSTVEAIGKDGGRETMPGPFFLLSEKAVEGQWCKFEKPTPEEAKMLEGAKGKKVNVKVAPKPTPLTALVVEEKEAPVPENKMFGGAPEKKDPPKKKAGGKGKGASKKTS